MSEGPRLFHIDNLSAVLNAIEHKLPVPELDLRVISTSPYLLGVSDALNEVRRHYRIIPGPDAAAPEAEDEPECEFCGWLDSNGWIMTRKPSSHYGPGAQEHSLCGFCWRSFAVSSYLAGGTNYSSGDRDQLMAANVLRAIALGREVTCG